MIDDDDIEYECQKIQGMVNHLTDEEFKALKKEVFDLYPENNALEGMGKIRLFKEIYKTSKKKWSIV